MRFGCVVVQNRPLAELRRDWQLIEGAGVGSIWVFDHLKPFRKMGVLLEAWATLAVMAAATSRVRIGPLVTNITFRNPALLAKQALSVDHLSGGRLELGIGAGSGSDEDGNVAGIEPWSLAERTDRFEEFVELTAGALGGAVSDFNGKYYATESFDRGPWPVQQPRIPLVIAANGPRTLRVAARHADTWNALGGFGRTGDELLAFLRSSNDRLDDMAAEFGRSPADVSRSLLVHDGGIDWWSSRDAFDDFIGRVGDCGIGDVIFYYPPAWEAQDKITPAALLDLLA